MRFQDIEADSYSYDIKQLNYKGELHTNNFLVSERSGALLELKLFYFKPNGKETVSRLIDSLQEVTFETDTRDYDCKLLNVEIERFGLYSTVAKLSYACRIYGARKVVNIASGQRLYIKGDLKTPLIIEATSTASNFSILGANFTTSGSGRKIVIDSLALKLTNCDVVGNFDFFVLKGFPTVNYTGLRDVKIYYRECICY